MKKLGLYALALLGLVVLVTALYYYLPTETWDWIPVEITVKETATPATDDSAGVYGAVDALKDAEANQASAIQNLQNKQNAATQAANNLVNAQATATQAANGVTNAKATVAAAGNTLIGAPTPTPTQTPALPTIGPRP
ncbi:hypothetical protein A2X44_04935 [candidate division CPR3 bacterium GWF2_35_18]|uniref:LPXTG-motif cell wall anchor domain protein n=1 Tax=candidate division CPR3 bacterium GW2011_GWF2_35_18 TaxID=1618350 RepID=A0A0G0BJW6_UNCC3|nr:MAG: LPXTG-motif cell wall anchor domain protein [candidate division CPR3 bacterium GW2011_GWF2_35_18]OGB63679.1 MAG: hypothetical protein A2X44_04935 [candidate division CPR3 bacterium GWF2_35_18]OGB65001.1 MAG: hypothetical protein A2250_01110 [candidate division CPR3 bacterium RIFOXYA2_FULL_35_13]